MTFSFFDTLQPKVRFEPAAVVYLAKYEFNKKFLNEFHRQVMQVQTNPR